MESNSSTIKSDNINASVDKGKSQTILIKAIVIFKYSFLILPVESGGCMRLDAHGFTYLSHHVIKQGAAREADG